MKLDSRLFQRLILAFTTGLFLSCAAKVSAVQSTEEGSLGLYSE